jgi:tetratricopeptide (TPR) repeat protein
MRAKLGRVVLCCCLLGILSLTACGGPAEEDREAETRALAADSEWAWLQQAKQELDTRREELARVARIQGSPAAEPLANDVRARTDEYRRRLLGFINDNPPAAGEKPAGRTLEAIRLKSDEDILTAREHIAEGGDYRMAIDIYEAALAVDPDNPRLRQELEAAQARRYMTAERFAQAQEGMTPEQVRALLGPPNANDVREYPERGVTAWFYAKDPKGGAAAVWFEKKGKGMAVYEVDFDALPAAK